MNCYYVKMTVQYGRYAWRAQVCRTYRAKILSSHPLMPLGGSSSKHLATQKAHVNVSY